MVGEIVSSRLPSIVEGAFRTKLSSQGNRGLSSQNEAPEYQPGIPYAFKGMRGLTSTLIKLVASAKNSSEKETMRPPRATEDTSVDVSLNSCWNWSRGMRWYVGADMVCDLLKGYGTGEIGMNSYTQLPKQRTVYINSTRMVSCNRNAPVRCSDELGEGTAPISSHQIAGGEARMLLYCTASTDARGVSG